MSIKLEKFFGKGKEQEEKALRILLKPGIYIFQLTI